MPFRKFILLLYLLIVMNSDNKWYDHQNNITYVYPVKTYMNWKVPQLHPHPHIFAAVPTTPPVPAFAKGAVRGRIDTSGRCRGGRTKKYSISGAASSSFPSLRFPECLQVIHNFIIYSVKERWIHGLLYGLLLIILWCIRICVYVLFW